MAAAEDCACCRHERELRELWEREHIERHVQLTAALSIARGDMNRRLEGMNELRVQVENERGRYVTRDLYDREHASLRDTMDQRLKFLETNRSNLEGRLWAVGAAISLVVSVVTVLLHVLWK